MRHPGKITLAVVTSGIIETLLYIGKTVQFTFNLLPKVSLDQYSVFTLCKNGFLTKYTLFNELILKQ